MENVSKTQTQEEKRKFFEFVEAIEQRVNDIGTNKGSKMRSADAVVEHLFQLSNGGPTKVTDAKISTIFDDMDRDLRPTSG